MQTTETILIVLIGFAVFILLIIMIALFVGVLKLLKTIQRIAEIAQDGTKTAADIVHEVKEKIINPMTMSAIFAHIMKSAMGNNGRKRKK